LDSSADTIFEIVTAMMIHIEVLGYEACRQLSTRILKKNYIFHGREMEAYFFPPTKRLMARYTYSVKVRLNRVQQSENAVPLAPFLANFLFEFFFSRRGVQEEGNMKCPK
jgi:hypothetical protein